MSTPFPLLPCRRHWMTRRLSVPQVRGRPCHSLCWMSMHGSDAVLLCWAARAMYRASSNVLMFISDPHPRLHPSLTLPRSSHVLCGCEVRNGLTVSSALALLPFSSSPYFISLSSPSHPPHISSILQVVPWRPSLHSTLSGSCQLAR